MFSYLKSDSISQNSRHVHFISYNETQGIDKFCYLFQAASRWALTVFSYFISDRKTLTKFHYSLLEIVGKVVFVRINLYKKFNLEEL